MSRTAPLSRSGRRLMRRWRAAFWGATMVTAATGSVGPCMASALNPGRAEGSDPSPEDASAASAPQRPAPPRGFEDKRPLTWSDYLDKREGGYFTGLPIVNFDTNTGLGYGGRLYYYQNGTRQAPLFAYVPYDYRLFLQIFTTTEDYQFHWLDFDAPALFGSPYRVRAQAIWERNPAQNFYGLGEAAMAPLALPGSERAYPSFSEYSTALARLTDDGSSLTHYNHFLLDRSYLNVSLERSLFGGILRPLVGLSLYHVSVRDWVGRQVEREGPPPNAPSAPTLLSEYCASRDSQGCQGGWDNLVRVGLSLDTRDFEPDPNQGVLLETVFDWATPWLGSQYEYVRWLLSARAFYSPFPDFADLVLAARATLELQSQGTPFFSLELMPYTDGSKTGLGGLRTLRGYRQDRFVGNVITLTNLELRWTAHKFGGLGQQFALFLVPFVDLGRVYDSARDLRLTGWARSQGAAVRLAWNQATIVSLDYGVSAEDTGLYVNFTHAF